MMNKSHWRQHVWESDDNSSLLQTNVILDVTWTKNTQVNQILLQQINKTPSPHPVPSTYP